MRFVLSIDGGGARGIIPATWLAIIEEETGRPAHELFDLVAGTSTGGLLAGGIAFGVPMYRARKLYLEEVPRVFRDGRSLPWTIWRPRYRARPLREVLQRYLPEGGRVPLGQARTRLMVTSYMVRVPKGQKRGPGRPYFWNSWNDRDRGRALLDALQATAQAPTYHPWHRIDVGDAVEYHTDGGVFATNPAACAYRDARLLWPDEPLTIVSMGTGEGGGEIEITDPDWGLLEWAKNIIPIVMDGQYDVVAEQMRALDADPLVTVYRLQIPRYGVQMDETDVGVLAGLEQRALEHARTRTFAQVLGALEGRAAA